MDETRFQALMRKFIGDALAKSQWRKEFERDTLRATGQVLGAVLADIASDEFAADPMRAVTSSLRSAKLNRDLLHSAQVIAGHALAELALRVDRREWPDEG